MSNICLKCGVTINSDRMEAISSLNLDKICLKCAENVRPIQALYLGEAGTSKMVFTDKISMQSGIYQERYIEPENEENESLGLTENDE